MDTHVLTQIQFHLNEAISCLFFDTLIWTSRYAGGNFDKHVIKKMYLPDHFHRRLHQSSCLLNTADICRCVSG